jgi:hypothetical protein
VHDVRNSAQRPLHVQGVTNVALHHLDRESADARSARPATQARAHLADSERVKNLYDTAADEPTSAGNENAATI